MPMVLVLLMVVVVTRRRIRPIHRACSFINSRAIFNSPSVERVNGWYERLGQWDEGKMVACGSGRSRWSLDVLHVLFVDPKRPAVSK